MTDEEWNKLHGYDKNGSPQQRFVWEGIGTGPPRRSIAYENCVCVWLVGMRDRRLKIAVRGLNDMWHVEPAAGARLAGAVVDLDISLSREEKYEDVIRKAFSLFMLKM